MARVKLENVIKRYSNGDIAVQDFNLEINDGEFVVLLGPSGCGKSALLKIIAGLENISKGNLYIDEVLVNDIPTKNRDIAILFQNNTLYPYMTVYENMAFFLKLKNLLTKDINKLIEETSNVLEIEELLDENIEALSTVDYQKISIGRAIVKQPKIFLMEEPLSNLDESTRHEMIYELNKLHKKLKKTWIYATSNPDEAMALADKIIVLRNGFIQQIDTPQKLYQKPNNLFVAEFMSLSQINLIDVTTVQENNKIFISFANFKIPLTEEQSKIIIADGYANNKLLMAIRPENIHEENMDNSAPKYAIQAKIAIKESSDSNIVLKIAGQAINAKINPHPLARNGEIIDLIIDIDKIMFFDKSTEKIIAK